MTREERAKYLSQLIIPDLFDNSHASCELRMKQEEALYEIIAELMQESYEELDFVQPHKKVSVNLVPCDDCISRQAAIDGADAIIARDTSGNNDVVKAMTAWKNYVEGLPPVTPKQKMGRWILAQRDKYIDINCSECGYTRIKEFAYNYTVDEIDMQDMQEIKELVVTSKMNYCECCGAKMREEIEK